MADFFFWALLFCTSLAVFLCWQVAGLHIRVKQLEAMSSALLAIANAQQAIISSDAATPSGRMGES